MSECDALGNLGVALSGLGLYKWAVDYSTRSLALARELNNPLGESIALGNLGSEYFNLGDVHAAIGCYEQQLRIAQEKCRDPINAANALGDLGNAYALLGEMEKSLKYYDEHLALARTIGDRRGEANSLYSSALGLFETGRIDDAVHRIKRAVTIYHEIESPFGKTAQATLDKWLGV